MHVPFGKSPPVAFVASAVSHDSAVARQYRGSVASDRLAKTGCSAKLGYPSGAPSRIKFLHGLFLVVAELFCGVDPKVASMEDTKYLEA